MAAGVGKARRPSAILKRSLVVAGHATSISMEQAFWDGLKAVAAGREQSVPTIVAEIDQARQGQNLSSAVRVFVFEACRARSSNPEQVNSAEQTSAHGRPASPEPL